MGRESSAFIMSFLKKSIRILVKTLVSCVVFYLVAGFIIIPLAAVWIVPWQGSKILATPVKLRSVFLNPLTLRVWVNGFQIRDEHQQPVIGFKQLTADVSFTRLFKKIIRIEELRVEEPEILATLLPDGQINLLELIPEDQPAANKASEASRSAGQSGQQSPEPGTLPLVVLDQLRILDGTVRFEDRSIEPRFSTVLSDIKIEVTGFTTRPEAETKIAFNAKLDREGTIAVESVIQALKQPLSLETDFKLNNYALNVLTPYVGKFTGRDLADGRMDMNMVYRINDQQLSAQHKLLIQHFEFGQKVNSPDALSLPFGLAVALLEDPQGRIDISLPVSGDMSDPQFEFLPLLGQVVRNFFMKLVTKPFTMLASLVGGADAGTEELGYVRFAPGKTELNKEEEQKIQALIKGLEQRPRLQLEIDGSYDVAVDWKAIQADLFERDYKHLRAESSASDADVYQMLFQRRFGLRDLWALSKEHKEGLGDYQHEKLNREIKRRLIEEAPPDPQELKKLARARAQAVYDFFVKAGFPQERLSMGAAKETQSTLGAVPMEFTLIFDQ